MFEKLNAQRLEDGFLTPGELLDLRDRAGIRVLDPMSTLVSRHVVVRGPDTTLYPSVVIECSSDSMCEIGCGSTLYPGTHIVAASGGCVTVGAAVQLGEGGTRLKADHARANIAVDDRARINGGAQVLGTSHVGVGAQIVGAISARNVVLAAGEDHTFPDPDHRGAVLKGFGQAREITLGQGEVIAGAGNFRDRPVERQRHYHPDSPRL